MGHDQLHSQFSPGDMVVVEGQKDGKFSQNGKLCHSCARVMKCKLTESQSKIMLFVHLGLNVSSSAHNCGCMIDGGNDIIN